MRIICKYPYPHVLDSRFVATREQELIPLSLPRRSFKTHGPAGIAVCMKCAFDVVCFSSGKNVSKMFRQTQKYIHVKKI